MRLSLVRHRSKGFTLVDMGKCGSVPYPLTKPPAGAYSPNYEAAGLLLEIRVRKRVLVCDWKLLESREDASASN